MIIDYLIILFKSIICIPLLFFIPGFLANSIISAYKPIRFDPFIMLHILVSIIITSFVGLTLAQLGLFSLINLIVSLFLISIFLYFIFKKSNTRLELIPTISLNLEIIIVICLIFSTIFLFFQPFPWIAGDRDPGVYVSTGVNIAKTGSIFIKDPLLAQMNTSIQEALYDVEPSSIYGFISWENPNFKFLFPGFFITDLGSGTVVPQFLQIFPVWIAIFYSIFGLTGIFYVNPIFGLLSIGSFYILGKKLFSWKVAALACFLLVLSFAQIWYARYPFAEIMTQFFILSGFATFIHFNRTYDRYLAVISGMLFGLSFLTKFDGIFLLIPLSIYYMYLILCKKWNRSQFYFLFTLLIILIYCSFDYFVFTKPYINLMLDIATKSPPSITGTKLNIFNIILTNTNILSWYQSSTGILLAIIGFVIILMKKDNPEKILLVFVASMFTAVYLLKLEATNPPPWIVRRFVPIVFPLFALFASYALKEITGIWKIGKYVSYLLITFLIISLAITSSLIINHKEGDGLIMGVSKLSENFNDNDIVFTGSSYEGFYLSTPLYFIYDKNVIFLYKNNMFPQVWVRELTPPEKISTGINYLLKQGYNIYVVSSNNNYMDGLLYYLAETHEIELVTSFEFSYKHLEPTPDNLLPDKIIDVPMKSNVYRVSNNQSNIFSDDVYTIDIGSPMDILYLKDGFYGMENWGDINNRWTSSNASVRLPSSGKNDLMMGIYAGGFRPDNIPPANVSIYINEHFIGNFTAGKVYEMHNLSLNKDYLSYPYSTLKIRSSSWKPSESIEPSDTRDLGINIEKIYIN